jgi:hypothetical protein
LSGTEGGEDDKSSKASGSELACAQLFGATAADRACAKRAAQDKEQRRLTAAGEALAAKEGASAARQAGWRAEEAARAEERRLERAKAEAEAVDAGERRRLRDAEADQARLEQVNVQNDRHTSALVSWSRLLHLSFNVKFLFPWMCVFVRAWRV